MSVNQNDIDALLNSEANPEDDTNDRSPVDDIVAQTLAAEEANKEISKSSTTPEVTSQEKPEPIDTSNLSCSDSVEKIRTAQKILFEVFSNMPDKKERARLLNWANDAFIKSKFF